MFEDRDRTTDIIAIGLLALTVFLGLSLVSYSPSDPVGELVAPFDRLYTPDQLVYPATDNAQNWCGQLGAIVSDFMLTMLGWGAYYFVGTLAVAAVLLLLKREIDSLFPRVLGWTLTLVGITTIASMISKGWNGPVMGPGGYLGTLGEGILQQHFARVGAFILASSVLLAGLLLWTDYLVVQLIALLGFATVDKAIAVGRVHRERKKRRSKATKVTEKVEVPDDLSIRIGGKKRRLAKLEELEDDVYEDEEEDEAEEFAEDEEEEETYDEESEQVEDVEEPEEHVPPAKTTIRGLISRAAPALRVRKPATKDEREEVIAQLEAASTTEEAAEYELPSVHLLRQSEDFDFTEQEQDVRRKARVLEKTFKDFGFKVRVVEVETGPVIAQYEIELEAGLRLSKIMGLADDLAIALRAPSVRIVAPIPGKNTVGIEVPNRQRQVVRLRDVIEDTNGRVKKMEIPLFLGKDVSGNSLVADLATLPHLLIAGRTGTGKSVCLNAIISSILMTRRPDEVRMLMIDPKMVELSGYRTLPHLMHPVVTDMRKAEALLAWAVDKMEQRYQLLARAGVRHISAYNALGEEELMETLAPENEDERISIPLHLPYIVIIADEMADLMMTAGKEVEQHIIRLAQKSRAVGIHLILATQKPTVDVITGLIKSNLPARIAFQVASRTDSRVVLDEMGADKLLGNGDMLFLWPGTSTLLRGQGTFVEDQEIKNIVETVSTGEQNFVNELVNLQVDEDAKQDGRVDRADDLYDKAVEIVIREGRGSVSLLQRSLGIGYGRGARMIDWMAEDGIVGAYAGSQAREVLISLTDWELQNGVATAPDASADTDDEAVLPSKAGPPLPVSDKTKSNRRSNKILPMSEWTNDDGEEVEESVKKLKANTVIEDEELDEQEKDEEYAEEVEDEEYEDAEGEEYEYEEDALDDEDGAEYEDEDEDEEVDEYDEEEYEDEEVKVK